MTIRAFSILALCFGTAGCGSAATDPMHPDVLAGPIPECPELMSAARQAYQEAARAQCKAATTMQERMNTKGCEIIQRVNGCPLNAKP